jgi:hypothetical protein
MRKINSAAFIVVNESVKKWARTRRGRGTAKLSRMRDAEMEKVEN